MADVGLGFHNAHLNENISAAVGVGRKNALFADVRNDNVVPTLIWTGRLVLLKFPLSHGICLIIHLVKGRTAH